MFKVGDKVMSTKSMAFFANGDKGIIIEICKDGTYLVEFEPSPTITPGTYNKWYALPIYLNLVEVNNNV